MGKKITIVEGHYKNSKVDHRSGEITEVIEEVEVRPVIDGYHNVTVRDKYTFGRDFASIFCVDIINLSKIPPVKGGLSLNEWRILMYLIGTLDKNNATFTNLEEISINLEIHKVNVCKVLKSLVKRHLIIENKIQRKGRGSQTLLLQIPIAQLNYNLVYNGQIKDYKRVKDDHQPITLTDGVTLIDPEKEQKRIEEKNKREPMLPGLFDQQ